MNRNVYGMTVETITKFENKNFTFDIINLFKDKMRPLTPFASTYTKKFAKLKI